MNQSVAFLVTRAKGNMNARRFYSALADRSTGLVCHQTIAFNGYCAGKDCPEHLQRIKFNDPGKGKPLVFLSNNMTLPTLTIAAPYKNRWQVELFFK